MRDSSAISLDYLMESENEAERIESKTDLVQTVQQLLLTGLSENHLAIDLGCASGATTREMAKICSKGSAVGLDLSEPRLQWARNAAAKENIRNVKFVRGSAYESGLQGDSFDFVWSRFLFEYLREPERALREMIRICKPGGKVVVADLDMNCLNHYPFPDHLRQAWETAINFAHESTGFDPYVGRKLYTFFYKAKLKSIKVHALNHHNIYGSMSKKDLDNWAMKLDVIEKFYDKIFKSKQEFEKFKSDMIALWKDPGSYTYTSLFLVEGVK